MPSWDDYNYVDDPEFIAWWSDLPDSEQATLNSIQEMTPDYHDVFLDDRLLDLVDDALYDHSNASSVELYHELQDYLDQWSIDLNDAVDWEGYREWYG